MPLLPDIGPDDHVAGPDASPGVVTLVHYGDFECPLSGEVHAIVREVREAFPTRVRFVYRHFPLRTHENALAAAVAADEAGRQGAFWPFHDRLFAHPLDLGPGGLVAHAEALGLDGPAVRRALDRPEGGPAVLAQKRDGVRAGVRSTLNLWIDGALYEDDALDEALTAQVIRPLRADTTTRGAGQRPA
jgi:protein-disulfide isomerase